MSSFAVITAAAVSIGFVHTLLGPDHYLPFVALSKAGKWSWGRTFLITALCGAGHILSSVLIGVIGIALGLAASKIAPIEDARDKLVAWGLITFGVCYMVWGIHRAWRNKPHAHHHPHSDGSVHSHSHSHHDEHLHVHDRKSPVSAWWLFVIFIFGPCEPLIPILMYPAAEHSWILLGWVVLLFGAVTISTMMILVYLIGIGISLPTFSRMERYSHALAGFVILLCGVSIVFGL